MPKLDNLFSNLDKIVAYGGFASWTGLLGFVVEKGYQDVLGFAIPVDNAAYSGAFHGFLTKTWSVLLDGLKQPAVLLLLLLLLVALIVFLAAPSAWIGKIASAFRRGSVAWAAPPALLCLGLAVVYSPALSVHHLLQESSTGFRLDPNLHSFSTDVLDLIVCSEVPPIPSGQLAMAIAQYCGQRGFSTADVAQERSNSVFRWLVTACALAIALYAFVAWCAREPAKGGESGTATPVKLGTSLQLRVLRVVAAVGLTLNLFGLCDFYGRVIRVRPSQNGALYFKAGNSGPLPCDEGVDQSSPYSHYQYGLVLAKTDKQWAFLCREILQVRLIAADQIDHLESSPDVAPLDYVMRRISR